MLHMRALQARRGSQRSDALHDCGAASHLRAAAHGSCGAAGAMPGESRECPRNSLAQKPRATATEINRGDHRSAVIV